MKLSKSNLIVFLVVGILVVLQIFFLHPYIKGKYFYSDIDAFKKESWKYSFILPSMLFVIVIILGFKNNMLNKTFLFSTFGLFLFVVFYSKRLTDDVLLCLNSQIKVEKFSKYYIVLRNDQNKVFHVYDNKNEFVFSEEFLNKIDSLRLKRNLKSLYTMQNNDTIRVTYKIGFLTLKFLE